MKVLRYDATSIELGWNQTYIDHVEFFKIEFRSGRTGSTRDVKSLGPVKRITGLLPGDNYRIWISTVSWGEESKRAFIEQRTSKSNVDELEKILNSRGVTQYILVYVYVPAFWGIFS